MTTSKQRGVVSRACAAILTVIAGFMLVANLSFPYLDLNENIEIRLKLLAGSLILPTVVHMINIGRLAQHRFFCADDIDGSALTEGTFRARLLQALLQNTLEQFVLAFCVYFFAVLILKSQLIMLVPTASILFFLGRILFLIGYEGGAVSRAYGFALTYYSTVILGFISIYSFVR